jgi:hypothetical protein
MLRDMFPSAARNYQGYSASRNTVLLRYLRKAGAVLGGGSNFNHLLRRQFRLSVPLAKSRPALGLAIQHVVQSGSREKMVWVDAGWVVASVENAVTVRYRSVVDFPGDAVGQPCWRSIRSNLPIPFVVKRASPNPTSILTFRNERPKAILKASSLWRLPQNSCRATVPPKPYPMRVAQPMRGSGRLVAIINAAYRFISHSNLLSSAWLEPVAALERSAGSLILYAESTAYKRSA